MKRSRWSRPRGRAANPAYVGLAGLAEPGDGNIVLRSIATGRYLAADSASGEVRACAPTRPGRSRSAGTCCGTGRPGGPAGRRGRPLRAGGGQRPADQRPGEPGPGHAGPAARPGAADPGRARGLPAAGPGRPEQLPVRAGLGRGPRARHRVDQPRRAGNRPRAGRRADRRGRAHRAAGPDLVRRRRGPARAARLRHHQDPAHLPVLRRLPALPVRARAELHHVQLLRAAAGSTGRWTQTAP